MTEEKPSTPQKPPAGKKAGAKKSPAAKKQNARAGAGGTWRHWRLERDAEGIAWLYADRADAGANALSAEVLEELDRILDALVKDPPRGLVIRSAKPNGFIAGADVKEFVNLKSVEGAAEHIRRAHAVFDKLEAVAFPTAALIHGFCLGGGLELALACRYRVADDDPETKIGLPEVRLGIHPGFGGTVRLIRLIGAPAAMDLMLSGRSVNGRRARRLGLVDYAIARRQFDNAGRALVLDPPPPHRPPRYLELLNHRFLRPLLAGYLKRQVARRAAPSHYPAPYALIDLWRRCGDNPRAMLAEEVYSVAKLITGYTARNLVRVFLLQDRLKSLGKQEVRAEFRHVHVIGGGVMGGDIAAWCALQGLSVTVQDRKAESLARVLARARDLYEKKLRDPRRVTAALDRLTPDLDGLGLKRADVVIEAIFEDVGAKQSLFREIEPRVRPGTVIATNTSSIPLETLGQAFRDPARLVGLHFFNPVAKMQLVEIVHGEKTTEEVQRLAAAFTQRIRRLPLPVKSGPGFLVNRILMPYLMEAVVLLEEGVAPALIDKAALDFGMPMGPIHLADTVGLDICLHVAENLTQAYGGEVPAPLRQRVEAGQLGKKTGQGFYRWSRGKPQRTQRREARAPADLTDRLMLRMLNEAVSCLRERVVGDPDLLDAGVIFGTGFAPFHGGPLHYVHHTGPAVLRARLEELAKVHGERFRPDPGWAELEGS